MALRKLCAGLKVNGSGHKTRVKTIAWLMTSPKQAGWVYGWLADWMAGQLGLTAHTLFLESHTLNALKGSADLTLE